MRFVKCLLVTFFITFGGSYLTFKILALTSDNVLVQKAVYKDVFLGYKPKYKRGFIIDPKLTAEAHVINEGLEEFLPWMLLSVVCFFSLSMYPVFKIWSYAWWN
jgi:hypothetical protein